MKIYILGICGTFMSGVAQLAIQKGFQVSGCDENIYPPISDVLKDLGVKIDIIKKKRIFFLITIKQKQSSKQTNKPRRTIIIIFLLLLIIIYEESLRMTMLYIINNQVNIIIVIWLLLRYCIDHELTFLYNINIRGSGVLCRSRRRRNFFVI